MLIPEKHTADTMALLKYAVLPVCDLHDSDSEESLALWIEAYHLILVRTMARH